MIHVDASFLNLANSELIFVSTRSCITLSPLISWSANCNGRHNRGFLRGCALVVVLWFSNRFKVDKILKRREVAVETLTPTPNIILYIISKLINRAGLSQKPKKMKKLPIEVRLRLHISVMVQKCGGKHMRR